MDFHIALFLFFIAVSAFLISLGVAIDRFTLGDEKAQLHARLKNELNNLERISIPDIPREMASRTVNFFRSRFSGNIVVFAIKVFITSILLTMVALVLGRFTFGSAQSMENAGLLSLIYDRFVSMAVGLTDTNAIDSTLNLFFTNFIFDSITAGVTFTILHYIIRKRSRLTGILLMIDIIIAGVLAIACCGTLIYFLSKQHSLTESFIVAFMTYKIFITQPDLRYINIVLYSSTTLIPTIVYISILIWMFLAKTVSEIIIRFLVRFTEINTPEEAKDVYLFTSIGCVLSVMSAFMGIIVSLLKVIKIINM